MNTWFLESFLYGILTRCWIYYYANAKYCLLLHTRYLFDIYLQINSTDTIGTELNLLQAQSQGTQTVLVTSKLLLVFLSSTNFCTIFHYFQNLFKSLFQKSNP